MKDTAMGEGASPKPKVSVIIPVHEGRDTINECLDSVLAQTFRDFELIVVCSHGPTMKAIEDRPMTDPRVRLNFEGKPGRGLARSVGVGLAKGDILAWTDADCIVPVDWLVRLIGPILAGISEVVQGNEYSVTSDYWSRQVQDADQRHMDSMVREPPFIDHLDTKNLAITKSLILEVGGFDRRIRALEDFELKVRLARGHHKIYYLRDLKVGHHHRSSFRALMRSRFEQGYWAAIVYYLHKDHFNSGGRNDNTVRSMRIWDLLLFPLHLVRFLVRNGPRMLFFEVSTGLVWRLGNIKGRFGWKEALGGL